ncbi:disease resistance protein Pikm1-TS-like isoform X2 [Phragmites australis]|uniref:disease resistance protein Pikm1-TS-like isoform X2 n=1 Tax=Phragmites australis TaxID=29695 RepID=UPI002D79BD60|nr:disease resistance protein Pikm1-TS-like isoform X2 [Phragmites australis]
MKKIVIKVQMACDKCRSKAMALVAATGGVDSVALAGDARDQVVVVGDGVDSVKLTSALRKKVGPAQLLQVGEDKKKEDDKKPAAAFTVPQYWYCNYPPPQQHPAGWYDYGYVYQSRPDNTCSIM